MAAGIGLGTALLSGPWTVASLKALPSGVDQLRMWGMWERQSYTAESGRPALVHALVAALLGHGLGGPALLFVQDCLYNQLESFMQ